MFSANNTRVHTWNLDDLSIVGNSSENYFDDDDPKCAQELDSNLRLLLPRHDSGLNQPSSFVNQGFHT